MNPTWFMATPATIYYMYYVYVLFSEKTKQFYIGFTNDLKRRFLEHKIGQVDATRNRRPLILLYYEAHTEKTDAKRREKYYKTSKGKSSLRQMLRKALDRVQI